MNPNPPQFHSGVVAPVECLKAGWATIKDRYWLFLGITLVALLIGGAVPIVLIGPMMCGLYLCLLAKMRGEPVEFGSLFKGFDYFVPGLIAALIQMAPILIIILPAEAIFVAFAFVVVPHDHAARNEGLPAVFFVVLVIFMLFVLIVSIAIQVLFLFAYPLIVDRQLSGWDAIKTSARAALKNFGGLLGVVLLNTGLSILGVIACFVGVIFVLPIAFAAYAAAYRQVFPDIPGSYASPPPPPASWAA
jgi:uncharacterized membrane protein